VQYHTAPFNLKEFKLEVTSRCDLNCIHCSSDAQPSNTLEMSSDDCVRILTEAASMGAQTVAFSGGEPLLWSHINKAVETASIYKMNIAIYTSGYIEGFLNKAKLLGNIGVSRFIISTFGSTPSSHEHITRKAGSFGRTQSSIQEAITANLTTELHFVPMASNYRELTKIAQIAHGQGVAQISVLRLVPHGRATLMRDRILNRVQNLELRQQIQTLRKEYGDDFIRTGSPYNFLMTNKYPGCFAAINRLIIGPDLRLFPCDAFKRIRASELVNTDDWSCLVEASLPDCWERSPYLEAVRTFLTTDFEAPCDSCRSLEECLSGCLAQKVIAYDSFDKRPDPACLGSNFDGDSA